MTNLKELLDKLAVETDTPCVTLTMRTHRTHPDNAADPIALKKALRQAQDEVMAQWGKDGAAPLLKKLDSLAGTLDMSQNEESLQIYLSNETEEVVRSPFPPSENRVQVGHSFRLRGLMEVHSRTQEYFIAVVEKGGVKVYWTKNNRIVSELENADFPFPETPFFAANPEEAANAPHMNNLLSEYLNRVDKALVRLYEASNRTPIVVISTQDNWGHLIKEADKPGIYAGHEVLDYNHADPHTLEKQGWKVMQASAEDRRQQLVESITTARTGGNVLTLPADIETAAKEGRGETLLLESTLSYGVPVKEGEARNDTGDIPQNGGAEDLPAGIAWEVLSKGGKVAFVAPGALGALGNMALKTRY